MTNETIVRMYPRPDPKNMEAALNLARADERAKLAGLYHSEAAVDAMIAKERAKMQGVDVSVSWSGGIMYEHRDENHSITIPMVFANFLGLAKGECAKFKIVRCE